LAQIETICTGLLREDVDSGSDVAMSGSWRRGQATSSFDYPPEINDEVVKDALREWVSATFFPLRRAIAHAMNLRLGANTTDAQNRAELNRVLVLVNDGTISVDKIVDRASTEAKGRVHALFIASVTRAALGLVWALVTAFAFGKLWRPYIVTYNKLQVVEQQLDSLLRAAFDVVVPVSAVAPFNVIGKKSELRHFLGRDLPEPSILSSVGDPDEAEKLSAMISQASGTQKSASQSSYWWQMLPMKPPGQTPVAPMIQTRWSYGPEDQLRSLNLELFVVSLPREDCSHMSILLAVRKTCDDPAVQRSEADALCEETSVPLEATVSPADGIGSITAFRPVHSEATRFPMSDSISSGDHIMRSIHGSSSADTNTDVLPLGGGGAWTPQSEFDGTPPPTIIGRGGNSWMQDRTPQPVNVTDFAMQIQSALQGSSSGSETSTV